MMKPRSSRVTREETMSQRNKPEGASILSNGPATSNNVQRSQNQLNNQQASAQAIRKRRSSINVYDQPSSLNSRLRQLETDMLRLDEDRTKLFDDTHSALAQSELRLNEIHAILKSRQDNVEKYVDDMKMLLQAKEEFEKQSRLLNEKQDRLQEKFMHRETTISREIKLLKNKFELLEKNRQFRSILHKSNNTTNISSGDISEHLASGLEGGVGMGNVAGGPETLRRKRSEPGGGGSANGGGGDSLASSTLPATSGVARLVPGGVRKMVRIESGRFSSLRKLFGPLLKPFKARMGKFNKVSSVRQPSASFGDEHSTTTTGGESREPTLGEPSIHGQEGAGKPAAAAQ